MTFDNANRSNSGSNVQNFKEIGSTIDSEQLSAQLSSSRPKPNILIQVEKFPSSKKVHPVQVVSAKSMVNVKDGRTYLGDIVKIKQKKGSSRDSSKNKKKMLRVSRGSITFNPASPLASPNKHEHHLNVNPTAR